MKFLLILLLLSEFGLQRGWADPSPPTPSSCLVTTFKVSLEEIKDTDPENPAKIRELLKTMAENPEPFAKEIAKNGFFERSLKELFHKCRSPMLQREASEVLKKLPTTQIQKLTDWLDVAILPSLAFAPIKRDLLKPFHQLTTDQTQYLKKLLTGVQVPEDLARRMRQIAAAQPKLTPEQKRMLTINLAEQFNAQSVDYKFHFPTYVEPSPAGDYFLCATSCYSILIFAADKKVYAGRTRDITKNIDPAHWRDGVVDLYEVTP